MAFKELQDLSTDTTVAIGGFNKKAKKDNPTSIEGYYLGTRTVNSPKSKGGVAKLHVLQTSKGVVGVWGKTDLDNKMGQATLGLSTRISFDKMVPTPNGEMYKFKVAQDSENAIEVSALPAVSASDYQADSQDSEEYGDETDDTTEVRDEDFQAAQAARQAHVQQLLNKNKGK